MNILFWIAGWWFTLGIIRDDHGLSFKGFVFFVAASMMWPMMLGYELRGYLIRK